MGIEREPPRFGRAVVVGAGMAGLLAARSLAEHFDTVTVFERDRLPPGSAPRRGVPQGQHLHVLLARGGDILERRFPGMRAELAAAGAPLLDATADIANLGPIGWLPNRPTGLVVQSCSRPFLEAAVRARVAAEPRIQIRDGHEVVGLIADGGAITGVRLRPSSPTGEHPNAEEVLAVDLVVDASGRASRVPRWLEELGYLAPCETVISSFLGYASRYYAPPAGFRAPWKGMYLQYAPPAQLRAGTLLPVEGERWLVGLFGFRGDAPPTDEAGFLAFARGLRSPFLHDAIRDARPLGPIVGYHGTENRLRHYDRLPRWPEGLVALGDAAATFNPVYGQGMTVAAIGALALGDALREQRLRSGNQRGLGARFQRRLARRLAPVWALATNGDLRAPATEGARPSPMTRLLYHYLDRVFLRVGSDMRAVRIVLEVYHLRRPLAHLFHPAVLVPTVWGTPFTVNPWVNEAATLA